MKRVTVSEARQNWFRLLDEVAAGETVVVERHGVTIVIRRELATGRAGAPVDYSDLISVPGADDADEWGWDWNEGELAPRSSTGRRRR